MRSMNRGTDWTAISEDLTSGGKQGNVAYGTLTSIDESKFQFGLLYTGSDDGKVFVSQNSGSDWQDISTTLPKDLWVSRVVASTHKKQRVYLTLNGYRWDDFTPYVYMSDNYGASWTNISNNLPLASVNVIREDPANPAILYLGTDNGAYTSFDNGASWNPFYEGLPNVAVHDLTIQARDKHLLLGTHGRSIYKADISLLQGISEKTMGSLMLADIASVRASRRWGSTGFNNYGAYFEPSVPLQIFAPLGGDAAVIDHKKQTVVTTDLLIEGVHFDLSYMPLKHLGYKSVVVNVSDIFAMNATPTQITVSIAVSNRFPVEALEELYAGIATAAKYYNVDVIGGDTTSSTHGLMISITALGEVDKKQVVYRDGAKENDLVLLTGDLGAAYLGLQILEREKQVFQVNPNSQPDLEPYSYLIERQLKPEARKDIPALLKDLGVKPTSMIDVSDGLSSEILHICKQSEVGCTIYEDKIPLDPQVITTSEEFNMDSTTIALNGGEDYELLFTISQEDYPKIKANPNMTVIGHILKPTEGTHLITRDNTKIPLIARGWSATQENE
jgi:thiamine-monophosphate kinase